MRCLTLKLICLGLLLSMPAIAQQAANGEGSVAVPTMTPGDRPTSIAAVTIYLHLTEGRWSASLSGDVRDPATEQIEVLLADNSLRVWAAPPRGGTLCLTKMKDRAKYGYLTCNSAFYSSNKASSATATLLRGVLSLGILTVADAASGNTGFTVSLDQQALEAAATEAKAMELARESAPLVEYRGAYAMANSPQKLRDFIARYEGVFDPESLVAKAQQRLPKAIEREEARAREKAEADSRQAEAQRQKEAQRLAELEALGQFQAKLRPGDRVKMMVDRYTPFFGMVIEVKPPLAYIQWDNVTPPMRWVRVDSLLPPR